MKNLLLTFFIFSNSILFTQNIAPVGAKWYYSISQIGGAAPPDAEYAKYSVTKDTLYKGQLAKQVEREYFRYSGDTVKWSTLYLFDRNDTVFYYNNQYGRYIPLYDFTAIAGDTLRFYYPDTASTTPTDSTFSLVVDSVKMDSFPNSIILKAIYTSPLGSSTISGLSSDLPYLEKIGSLSILLPRSTLTLYHDGPLRCYEDSNININYTAKACDQRLVLGISNFGLVDKSIQLTPNPVSDILHIRTGAIKIQSVEIYNMSGTLMRNIPQGEKRIDVSFLENGIYLLQFQSEFGFISKKILVAK